MVSTHFSDNTSKNWSGEMACRHGGKNHSSWWYQRRQQHLPIHSYYDIYNSLDKEVYVLKLVPDVKQFRNEFMEYIGGQSKIFCGIHNLPLIVTPSDGNSCHQLGINNVLCGKKYQCNVQMCHVE